jgi:hypothetical protein
MLTLQIVTMSEKSENSRTTVTIRREVRDALELLRERSGLGPREMFKILGAAFLVYARLPAEARRKALADYVMAEIDGNLRSLCQEALSEIPSAVKPMRAAAGDEAKRIKK